MAHSLADRYRQHRIAFELARELGVTPREAEAVLAQREARARWLVAERRLAARMGCDQPRPSPATLEAGQSALWYRQGDMA